MLPTPTTLITNTYAYWRYIYLAPDWSKEERAAYSKLTTDLKQKVIEDAGKYHYIRDEKIVSVDEVQSTAGTLSNQEH